MRFERFVGLAVLVAAMVMVGCVSQSPMSDRSPLAGQAMFADIAKNDEDPALRIAAIEKLTDQALLADLARNAKDYSIRMAAADRLDRSYHDVVTATYVEAARKGETVEIRKDAMQKLAAYEGRGVAQR